jgi:hypothetical protein
MSMDRKTFLQIQIIEIKNMLELMKNERWMLVAYNKRLMLFQEELDKLK